MNLEDYYTHGLGIRAKEIYRKVAEGTYGHNDLLRDKKDTEMQLALYAKHNKMDKVQEEMLGEIKLLGTMAWRIYMFGKPNRLAVNPGMGGELARRLRTDLKYHASRDAGMARFGEWGCQAENNKFTAFKRPCLKPGCQHKGIKYAHKALKAQMRQEWERDILTRYTY